MGETTPSPLHDVDMEPTPHLNFTSAAAAAAAPNANGETTVRRRVPPFAPPTAPGTLSFPTLHTADFFGARPLTNNTASSGHDRVLPSQRVAGVVSIVLSFVVMVLAFVWGATDNPVGTTDDPNALPAGYLGGLSDPGTLHAVLMIFGFLFSQAVALMSYRVLSSLPHRTQKIVHGFSHVVTVSCVVAALVFIVQDHVNNGAGHLASLHSWLGVVVLTVFSQNFVLGVLSFALPKDNSPARLRWAAAYLPSHRFLGLTTTFLAALAMCTGILQEEWNNGGSCIYPNTDPQLDPVAGYTSIPPGCRLANAIGVLIALNAAVACYALTDLSQGAHAASSALFQPLPLPAPASLPESKMDRVHSATVFEEGDEGSYGGGNINGIVGSGGHCGGSSGGGSSGGDNGDDNGGAVSVSGMRRQEATI